MTMRNTETREYLPTRRGEWSSAVPSIGDLFQTFFSPAFLGSNTGATMPALDLKETPEGYTIALDVPGFTMDQINVQFAENVLTLSAERPEEVKETTASGKKDEDARWHIVERSRGSFSRSIKFPVPVDAANVKAALKNGVLTVTVPKGVEARPHKIKITES
jgi:HSP20 family protein